MLAWEVLGLLAPASERFRSGDMAFVGHEVPQSCLREGLVAVDG